MHSHGRILGHCAHHHKRTSTPIGSPQLQTSSDVRFESADGDLHLPQWTAVDDPRESRPGRHERAARNLRRQEIAIGIASRRHHDSASRLRHLACPVPVARAHDVGPSTGEHGHVRILPVRDVGQHARIVDAMCIVDDDRACARSDRARRRGRPASADRTTRRGRAPRAGSRRAPRRPPVGRASSRPPYAARRPPARDRRRRDRAPRCRGRHRRCRRPAERHPQGAVAARDRCRRRRPDRAAPQSERVPRRLDRCGRAALPDRRRPARPGLRARWPGSASDPAGPGPAGGVRSPRLRATLGSSR